MIIDTTVKIENHPYSKEFSTLFNTLSQKYDKARVWNDFIVMVACAISNACDKRFYKEREERYIEIVKQYTRDEQNKFAELFSYLVLSLDEKTEQDFLGAMFTMLGLSNKAKGQFFTPYDVAVLLANIQFAGGKNEITDKQTFSVSDQCCGSGTLLIAFANEAYRKNINHQSRITFVAQDIDNIAGLMCYIQMSLLGCKLILKIGDTLADPITDKDMESESVWLSPMFTHEKRFKMLDSVRMIEKILNSSPMESGENEEKKTA